MRHLLNISSSYYLALTEGHIKVVDVCPHAGGMSLDALLYRDTHAGMEIDGFAVNRVRE